MTAAREGTLHGQTITLDQEVPPLEGRRVRVLIEPLEERDIVLSPEAQAELWKVWAENGPQGPIEDEGEPEIP
jgi:hypothetical protein